MNEDPRYKNHPFNRESLPLYFAGYVDALTSALRSIDPVKLEQAFALFRKAQLDGKRIYAAGNGGSAAIVDHLCCDFGKGTWNSRAKPVRIHSLVGMTATLTAYANDYGYDQIFSGPLKLIAEPGDVLLCVSSSGNSPNILNALSTAKDMGVSTIGFTGFSGGALAQRADVHIHVGFDNYGVVEDCHQILAHVISQFLAVLNDRETP